MTSSNNMQHITRWETLYSFDNWNLQFVFISYRKSLEERFFYYFFKFEIFRKLSNLILVLLLKFRWVRCVDVVVSQVLRVPFNWKSYFLQRLGMGWVSWVALRVWLRRRHGGGVFRAGGTTLSGWFW